MYVYEQLYNFYALPHIQWMLTSIKPLLIPPETKSVRSTWTT
jgi:hypothetical protein